MDINFNVGDVGVVIVDDVSVNIEVVVYYFVVNVDVNVNVVVFIDDAANNVTMMLRTT